MSITFEGFASIAFERQGMGDDVMAKTHNSDMFVLGSVDIVLDSDMALSGRSPRRMAQVSSVHYLSL
eukprot:CAMPEP_0114306470 /NCGR_PEP_ID=MMETSP0059-20121206/16920_1 /TAXON_ID=36894 /ORGANISM="Pyramimonas parkeae, Strain CCMP726" /LENGTH=66 /DNA_ID=CAMNT_0001429803 /DNA_START=874 /DNA_END=1071 /DNA_ORIENTATION=+